MLDNRNSTLLFEVFLWAVLTLTIFSRVPSIVEYQVVIGVLSALCKRELSGHCGWVYYWNDSIEPWCDASISLESWVVKMLEESWVVKMLEWKLHCTLNPTLCAAVIRCLYTFFCMCMCAHFDSNYCSFHHVFSQPIWTNVWNLLALLYNLICAILFLSYFAVTNKHLLSVKEKLFASCLYREWPFLIIATSLWRWWFCAFAQCSTLPWQGCGRFVVLKCASLIPGTISACVHMFAHHFNKFLHFIPVRSLLLCLTRWPKLQWN